MPHSHKLRPRAREPQRRERAARIQGKGKQKTHAAPYRFSRMPLSPFPSRVFAFPITRSLLCVCVFYLLSSLILCAGPARSKTRHNFQTQPKGYFVRVQILGPKSSGIFWMNSAGLLVTGCSRAFTFETDRLPFSLHTCNSKEKFFFLVQNIHQIHCNVRARVAHRLSFTFC